MRNIKKVISLFCAFMLALSCLPAVYANYSAESGYGVGDGVIITSTDLFNDGIIKKGSKNVQYDEGSGKRGVVEFKDSTSDKQAHAVYEIFGTSHTYGGVVDYAGTGKGKGTLSLPISIISEKNYFVYVLVPAAKNIYLWLDDTSASTQNASTGGKNPLFTVEATGGYVYAFDLGTLSIGEHTLTFDGSSGAWLPDICVVAVYPTDADGFLNPYQNESLSFEERAADLVSRMTLEEKCSQLGHNAAAIPRLGVSAYYYWREAAHGVVDQGQATSFPVSLSISNSWDTEMYHREAQIVSTEARVKNNRYNLNYWAPTINMQRDPRWGRNNETFGEDPYLTSQFGTEFVKGMQGDGESKYLKTIATLKHFLANNCEYERQTGSSEMTEEALRNYYSLAFKNVVENASPGAMMSSYNATTITRNGEKLWDYIAQPANEEILTNLLRRNWGFDGFVTGDCGAVADLNGSAFKRALFPDAEKLSDVPQSATVAKAIKAGNELDCGNVSAKYAMEAVEKGYMSEDDLDSALYRVFLKRFQTGEFDDTDVYRTYTVENDLETDENVAAAEEAAEKGIVLLQNTKDLDGDTLLPLDKDKNLKIALVGEMASQAYIGDYSGSPTKNVTPYEGIRDMFGAENVEFLGHANDDDVLFNIKSIKLRLSNGTYRDVDLTTAKSVSGMKMEDGKLLDVTPVGSVTIPDVNFYDVTDVVIEMACDEFSPGGTVYVGYSNASNIKSEITSKNTGSLDTYTECEAPYTGADGDYNKTADMCLTVQAQSSFDVEKYKAKLDEADVIIAYSGTMVGNAEPETGLVADGHESNDRTTISLPYRDRHVSAICNYQEDGKNIYADKTVVVMQTVGEVDVRPFKDNCRAMLWTSYNGQRQGAALAKVLSGDVNPSGKLTSTWYDPEDLEIMTCGGVHTVDDEGITWKRNNYNITQEYDKNGNCTWPGRTYMYYNGTPQYPFGYGMSYTEYEYSNLTIDKTAVNAGDKITVSVDVKNIGSVAGTEIVQIYLSHKDGDGISLPLQQLVGFNRVDLKPNETKTVTIEVDTMTLSRYSETLLKNYIPTGEYTLYVSKNVTDKENSVKLNITGEQKSEIKTVYSVPNGISVYGAYDNETNTTKAINTITQDVSCVMSDEKIVDMNSVNVLYTSRDESIATVDKSGCITAGVKEGVTMVDASITIDGKTKTASVPVVCHLKDAISSTVRNSYITNLNDAYSGYNKDDYREKFWIELSQIYESAKLSLENEVDEENLSVILTDALEKMAAVRKTLKTGEWAYTLFLTPDWYYGVEVEAKYNGDEDEPKATLIAAVYGSDGVLKDTKIEDLSATMENNQKIQLKDLSVGDTVKCYALNNLNEIRPMSLAEETVIEKPPAHVVYDLSDEKYDRLGVVMDGEQVEKQNGFGGFGSFNDVSGVNYSYTYNGTKYNLTGGFQGGKGSFTKTNVYFEPFSCYEKATVTVLFDSAGEERKVRIAQSDGTKDGVILGEKGGAGNKKIVALTVTVDDLSKPIYIQPKTKETIYAIIVDYEGESAAYAQDFKDDYNEKEAYVEAEVLSASVNDTDLSITKNGEIKRIKNSVIDEMNYNAAYDADATFLKLMSWNDDCYVALIEDNKTKTKKLIFSTYGLNWYETEYHFSSSDVEYDEIDEIRVNDFLPIGDQIYAACDNGYLVVITPCNKCYRLIKACDSDILKISQQDEIIYLTGKDNKSYEIALNSARQTKLSAEKAKEMLNSGAIIIDVREEDEYKKTHAEIAVNIPLSQIEDIARYSKDSVLIFCCQSGTRAKCALEYAEENGYTNVYNIGSYNEIK